MNRCSVNVSVGSEFQNLGAKLSAALLPVDRRQAEDTVRWMEDDDLREQEKVVMWRRSDKEGWGRLWITLKI